MPSVAELASLVDPNAPSAPFLPTGHPFTGVQSAFYWSATTSAALSTNALVVGFDDGDVDSLLKTDSRRVWCVRGEMNADQY